MGKTSVAVEYVHRTVAITRAVWWIPAENRTILIDSLAGLCAHAR